MKKIMLIANDTTYVYLLRKEIIEANIAKKNSIVIVCKQGLYVNELENMGCKLIEVSIERHGKNPLADMLLFGDYLKIIKREKPDVVLTYNIKPNVYGGMVCGILGIPYLVNVCGLGTPVEYDGPMQKLTCLLYKIGVKKAACVFFQNSENLNFFVEKRMLSGKYRVLPGSGVNLEKYKLLEYPQSNKINFLFVSRLMKEKGIEQYLDAAESIVSKFPNTVFHIVGGCDDPKYEEKVLKLEQKGIVVYHGQQKDMMPFQKMNCCAIHPTYYPEGMSNVLLEAAACGRPIITTNRSGCREIIDDGVNGFICMQKNSEDLIKQIEKFLQLSWEERREMGLAGRRKTEKEFDRNLVVKAYIEEINKVI